METTNIPENILENYNGAMDLPDTRDYTHEEVFGEMASSEALPKKVMLEKAEQLVQEWGSCTIVGGINASNETHKQANNDFQNFTDWRRIWQIAKTKGASDTRGWYLQSAQQLLKDEGITGGYVLVNANGDANIEAMKKVIALEHKSIYTGVAVANWSEVTRTHEYSVKSATLSGHAFDITGYDDDYKCKDGTTGAFFVGNSWNNGYFWLPYSHAHHLFTQYVNVYNSEIQKFIEAKNRRANKYLQLAFDHKIWNEERPADTASSSEIRIMLNRALAVVDNKISADWVTFRSSYAMLFEEKIIRGKAQIYNEKQKYNIASDDEIAIMFTRAVTRNPDLKGLVLTRQQVAEVIGRDFLSE